MTAGALELCRLTRRYGGVVAVDDVSLTIAPNAFVTLLGPSGSGKTTTLAMIAGLVRPSGGSILLDGRPLDPLPPHRRDIGVVFQNYALFPHMTVAGNIAFPLEMRRLPAAEVRQRVGQALERVGLAGLGARYPRQLSGGQQQRVALARAMVFAPRILLMDEPLGALDRTLRERMQIEIMRLHRDLGVTVVYVTHDQDEALMMSDRIAVFNHGRIEQTGTPQDLYDRPATAFVAGFLGESNAFPARVTQSSARETRLDGQGLRLIAAPVALPAGSDAVVIVRPERMRIAAGTEADAVNSVGGILAETIFMGRVRRYLVRLASGQEVAAIEQAGAAAPLDRGTAVVLRWRAEDAIALPAGG